MYLIANWKENKNVEESKRWIEEFTADFSPSTKVQVILAPSLILIPEVAKRVLELNLNIKLSSQSVSIFEDGSHTGEVSAFQLKEYVDYVIISHSEREAVGESIEDAVNQINLSLKYSLKPIVCLNGIEELDNLKSKLSEDILKNVLFAYEPVFAIGAGNPASIKDIENFKTKSGLDTFIYGGSIDINTVDKFLQLDYLQGFLVGSASLNSENFLNIYNKLCA